MELPKLHNINFAAETELHPLFEITTAPVDECDADDAQNDNGHNSQKQLISHTLHMYLCEMKEQIKECGEEMWDIIKKYTNPFEFIHTAIPNSKIYTVSKMRPLSRSFYKMIEIHATFFNAMHEPARCWK